MINSFPPGDNAVLCFPHMLSEHGGCDSLFFQLQILSLSKRGGSILSARNCGHASPLIHMLSGDEIFYLDLKFISHPLAGSHPPLFAKTRVNSTHTF